MYQVKFAKVGGESADDIAFVKGKLICLNKGMVRMCELKTEGKEEFRQA